MISPLNDYFTSLLQKQHGSVGGFGFIVISDNARSTLTKRPSRAISWVGGNSEMNASFGSLRRRDSTSNLHSSCSWGTSPRSSIGRWDSSSSLVDLSRCEHPFLDRQPQAPSRASTSNSPSWRKGKLGAERMQRLQSSTSSCHGDMLIQPSQLLKLPYVEQSCDCEFDLGLSIDDSNS
jgi:hypothetical protein